MTATLKKFFCFVGILSAALSGLANPPESLETIEGKLYQGIREIDYSGEKIRIIHEGGIAVIRQDLLTEESQKSLGLTPKLTAAHAYPKLSEIETLDGRKFTGITKLKPTPVDLNIMHDAGVITVEFSDLPQSVRESFGYEKEKAEAYRKLVAEQRAEFERRQIGLAAKINAEQKKKEKQGAIASLHYSTLGTPSYWAKSRTVRALEDEAWIAYLMKAGFSHEVADHFVKKVKFGY